MNHRIEHKPDLNHLDQIKEWLNFELIEFENGFYHNWNIINKAFEDHRMIVCLVDEKPVGFLTFSKNNLWCEIDILNVKEEFKRGGIGTKLFEYLEGHLENLDFYAIKLFCEPKESENFWRKTGFIKAPERGLSEHCLTYWKPLKAIIQPNRSINMPENRFEIWNKELVRNDEPPTLIYDLNEDSDIVAYVHYDWKCKIYIDGYEIDNCKLKYLQGSYDKYIYSPFLIIKQQQINEILKQQNS